MAEAGDAVCPVRASVLNDVPHGFLTRAGGVSAGPVAGLQFGTGAGDEPAAVEENRRRAIAAILPGADLAMPYQVHSADAVVVSAATKRDTRPRADALATATPGLLVGVVTADCGPVLMADTGAGVVAAAHAGWRGAVGGILDATLEAMESLGARRGHIVAAIGPAIAQANYEVGPEMRDEFGAGDDRFFVPGNGDRLHFDLEGYAAARLERAGIGAIEPLGLDTYSDESRFYSYRRASHRGEASYGRQAALIGLRATA